MNIWNDWKSPIAGHQWTRSVHRSRLEPAVPVRLFLHYSQGFLKENWHKNVKILLNGSPPDKAKASNFKFTWWQLLLLCVRQQKWLNVFRKLSFQRLCFWTRYILFFFFFFVHSWRRLDKENLSRKPVKKSVMFFEIPLYKKVFGRAWMENELLLYLK